MRNYKILKLKSGEDLVGTIRVSKDGTIKIHRPMVMRSMVSQDILGFMKEIFMLKNWLALSDDKVAVISKDCINTIVNASKDVSDLYDAEKTKQDQIGPIKPKRPHVPFSAPNSEDQLSNNFIETLTKQLEDMLNQDNQDAKKHEMDSNLKDLDKPQFNDKMVFMNMVFSPKVIIQMLKNGMLDRKEFGEIINEITNDNGEGMNPQKYTGNKKDKKNLGNDWTDWPANPDSPDYK
jgi:hypothetical protein